jgi:hypothetical protein
MKTGVTYNNSMSWELNQPISNESQPFISILPERLRSATIPQDISILPKELDTTTEPREFFILERELIDLK